MSVRDFKIKSFSTLDSASDRNGILWNPQGMEVAGLVKGQGYRDYMTAVALLDRPSQTIVLW